MKDNYRRGSLVGPFILIALGVLFLLQNLNLLTWSIWEIILRLWPILIIAIGLDILIGRRSIWGAITALLLTLALLVGAIWLMSPISGTGQVEEIRSPEGLDQARIVISPGVGRLEINTQREPDDLVTGEIRLGASEGLTQGFSESSSTFTIRNQQQTWSFFGGWRGDRTWSLDLNPEVELDLEITLGAGEADLDLRELSVDNLDVEVAVGQNTVILPESGRFDALIEGAIGETTVLIPPELEARIRLDTGLTARHIGPDFERQGDCYISSGYEGADHRVDLVIEQAIGEVSVRRYEGR